MSDSVEAPAAPPGWADSLTLSLYVFAPHLKSNLAPDLSAMVWARRHQDRTAGQGAWLTRTRHHPERPSQHTWAAGRRH